MHRRSASCILCVFVNCVIDMPWATFDAQAQYLVHSGWPTISTHSATAGYLYAQAQRFVHFVCFDICVISVPWATFDTQAQYMVHSGWPTISTHSATAGYFVCTGAAFRAFCVFLLNV